jgi:hypothetical protein
MVGLKVSWCRIGAPRPGAASKRTSSPASGAGAAASSPAQAALPERKSYRVGPKVLGWPNILAANPY